MREIDFRCWYGNEFVYTSLVGKDDVGYFFLETPECEKEYINSNPQQYTGLKDVNGVRIYEGDIVVQYEADWDNLTEEQDELFCCGKIQEQDLPQVLLYKDVVTMDRFPTYWLEKERFGYEGEKLRDPEYCTIIGNIYENPELLE